MKIEGYWNDSKNHHNIFIKFAQKHNFDPLVADNWYNINMNLFKGMQKVLYYLIICFIAH